MSGHNSDLSRAASLSSQTPRLSQPQISEPLARRASSRLSHVSNPNIFSDEYALEPIDTEINRVPSPASASTSASAPLHSTQHVQESTIADNEDPFADGPRLSQDGSRRSSLPQKGLGLGFASNRDSVSSSNNGQFAFQRNQSVSSRFSIPRAMSPYTGATGPSHPYGMYSQVGVSRSGSIASVSTIRPIDRPLGETSGPQHPYGMYSQNVVEEDASDNVIPVGFAAHNQPYQQPLGRRLDDVGDIIGPDGHAEPLPPYSRYPTGVVPKPPGAETTTSDVNILPEDQELHSLSREPPISESSSRALITETSGDNEHSEHNEPLRAVPLSGVMAFEEKLKQKGKKRVCCGLPVWTLVLIATVMLIGGCIGGVIGGILGTKRAAEDSRNTEDPPSRGPHIVTVTATPAMGFSEITSTPTNLKSIPTGYYLIPAVLQNQSGFCVEDHDFKAGWACQEKASDFEMYLGNSGSGHYAVLGSDGPTSTFTYGAQSPFLPTPTQNLSLAYDTSNTGLGPALFFYTLFDKLIILPQDTFSSSSLSSRSFSDELMAGMMERKEVSKPGEEPWFCWWNSTMMEFFLYINQSTSDTTSSTASHDDSMSTSTATSEAQYKNRRSSIFNYPRNIKIEERRDYSGAEAPYCQQMLVESSGQLKTIVNSVITIKEVEPVATTTYGVSADGSSQTYTAKAQYASPCYCLSSTDD
ncbi:hypothetical protein N7495_008129 [Penicillium taxi]|uniref:uncharacterized protein n=1 Tax=Penicillium taxi TaxID=168475 RepID=UPI00254547B9|nr:uncharacterized protein N7495_008129 [Penicillium taxi]KAJ5888088.1 hypothetical protein N7495_008129 [Penicillium taxi]